jgi:hypothetical protein
MTVTTPSFGVKKKSRPRHRAAFTLPSSQSKLERSLQMVAHGPSASGPCTALASLHDLYCAGSFDRSSDCRLASKHSVGIGELETRQLLIELANQILQSVPVDIPSAADLLPLSLMQPVRCADCFRRDYRLIFTPVRGRLNGGDETVRHIHLNAA